MNAGLAAMERRKSRKYDFLSELIDMDQVTGLVLVIVNKSIIDGVAEQFFGAETMGDILDIKVKRIRGPAGEAAGEADNHKSYNVFSPKKHKLVGKSLYHVNTYKCCTASTTTDYDYNYYTILTPQVPSGLR